MRMPALRSLFVEIKNRLGGLFLILFLCEFELLTALDAAGANLNATASRSLWECNPLEVGVFASIARRIEFRRADTVRITACHAASL